MLSGSRTPVRISSQTARFTASCTTLYVGREGYNTLERQVSHGQRAQGRGGLEAGIPRRALAPETAGEEGSDDPAGAVSSETFRRGVKRPQTMRKSFAVSTSPAAPMKLTSKIGLDVMPEPSAS